MSKNEDNNNKLASNTLASMKSAEATIDLKKHAVVFGTSSIWSDFMKKDAENSIFDSFDSKSLLTQSKIMTKALLRMSDDMMFDFDREDESKRDEVIKSSISALFFTWVITAIDMRGLNLLKITRKYSILQKLLVIQLMNSPFYIYFYTNINKSYMNLKKHLVYKYLIKDGKKVFSSDELSNFEEISKSDIL